MAEKVRDQEQLNTNNPREAFELLRGVYFFKNLSNCEIDQILNVSYEQTCQPNTIVFEEGEKADRFYIILEGSVEIWKDYNSLEGDRLAVRSKGHLFGEMALIDDLPRSATVVVKEPTRLLYINIAGFHKIIKENSSIALSVMKSVTAMVRRSNENYVEKLREQNNELIKANRELKETQEEMLTMERLSALGKFSSLILHDIKNPLSIMRVYAELIMNHKQDYEKVNQHARKIISEADRLDRLASELLDFSRGEIRLNMQIVSLKDLIDKVIGTLDERFKACHIDIVTNLAYEGPVLLDEERMIRVFLNLADNARKAMPQGGIFKINVYEKEKNYIIEISDNGVGMIESVKKRIFEPFFSFSERGGTGLGMSIVKSVVEAHEGTLFVTSEKNKGTCFTILLCKYN